MTLNDKLILVTGASRGIGHASALEIARRGGHVIAVARPRSQGALEALDDEVRALGGAATLVPLDLAKGDTLDQLGAILYERFGKLDGYIANAAILGPITPLTQIDVKDFDKLIAVNITAQWRLLRAMHPLLKAAGTARAVFLSSSVASKTKPYWGGYGLTKAALQHMALTYSAECENVSDIQVNIVDPGPTRTDMRAEAVPGEKPETLPAPSQVAALLADLMMPGDTRSGEVIRFSDGIGQDQ